MPVPGHVHGAGAGGVRTRRLAGRGACARWAGGALRKGDRGENSMPLILQNVHRYFMYLAVIFIFFLAITIIFNP